MESVYSTRRSSSMTALLFERRMTARKKSWKTGKKEEKYDRKSVNDGRLFLSIFNHLAWGRQYFFPINPSHITFSLQYFSGSKKKDDVYKIFVKFIGLLRITLNSLRALHVGPRTNCSRAILKYNKENISSRGFDGFCLGFDGFDGF